MRGGDAGSATVEVIGFRIALRNEEKPETAGGRPRRIVNLSPIVRGRILCRRAASVGHLVTAHGAERLPGQRIVKQRTMVGCGRSWNLMTSSRPVGDAV